MFSRSTIHLVLFLILFGAANSLKCQECSVNDYYTNCRAGTIKEATECSPEEDSCYYELLYGPENNYIPEYSRGCASSDFCDDEEEDHESDLQTCYTCQDDMCNSDPMEDDIGSFYSGLLSCQSCSDNNYNSDCRTGKLEDRHECQEGEDMCYEEYLIKGNTPLYKRGCANSDWCSKQKGEHDHDLKICRTCPEHMCNNDILGGFNSSERQCWTCETEDPYSDCKRGKNLPIQTCEGNANSCYLFHLSSFDISTWRRGCGTVNSCDKVADDFGLIPQICETCNLDLCNDEAMGQVLAPFY